MRLSFGAAPAGDMFKIKIDKTLNELLNMFDITNDILDVGYDEDGTGHDRTLCSVVQI